MNLNPLLKGDAMSKELKASFWNTKYLTNDFGWDIGYPSPPITEYVNQLQDQSISILIPGCGNGYEAEYLWRSGFENVHVLDYSEVALKNFKLRVPEFPEEQIHVEDFFNHTGQYAIIFEQTFFCALDPSLRSAYALKVKELLEPGGKLVGLLFNEALNDNQPPYGGNSLEYLGYFQPHFINIYMKNCFNSIQPRMGRELFVIFS
jgi:thiopurine S-methyltransferase